MKVRDLKKYIVCTERVVIYKAVKTTHCQDIYKGCFDNGIPEDILDMEVRDIGAGLNCILDIRVE